MNSLDAWRWIDAGMAIWWLFTGVVGLLALVLILLNLRAWGSKGPPGG